MSHRSPSLRLALVVVLALAGWHAAARYTFTPDSRVWIEGTSNVHGWECDAGDLTASLDGTASGNALTAISALTVTVPVTGIDCDNGTMNGKLREALGSSPIRFTLTNARVGSPNGNAFLVEADGRLTLHGQTRAQRVRARGTALGNDRYRFTGEVAVTMSQFGVDPPRALMGTLRTGDRATVHFNVIAAR